MTARSPTTLEIGSLVWVGIASLVALSILVGLGTWQLERKAWKESLLAQIEARAYGEPKPIASEAAWARWDGPAAEFQRVGLDGTFLDGAEIQLHGLTQLRGSGVQGFYIFAPFRLDDGSVVLVNRGFVPTELRAPARRVAGVPAGRTRVTGLIRQPETRGSFVPANDPAHEDWFVRDLADMARARSLSRIAPFYVDADGTPNPGGWPLGGQTRLTLPNDHLQYAITWFGLAGALVGVAGAFAWTRLRAASAVSPHSVPIDRGPGHRHPHGEARDPG